VLTIPKGIEYGKVHSTIHTDNFSFYIFFLIFRKREKRIEDAPRMPQCPKKKGLIHKKL